MKVSSVSTVKTNVNLKAKKPKMDKGKVLAGSATSVSAIGALLPHFIDKIPIGVTAGVVAGAPVGTAIAAGIIDSLFSKDKDDENESSEDVKENK